MLQWKQIRKGDFHALHIGIGHQFLSTFSKKKTAYANTKKMSYQFVPIEKEPYVRKERWYEKYKKMTQTFSDGGFYFFAVFVPY